ncbi:MAG TPA: site-2 protease family protein, partial [Candidatus Paceibacterota bacterium]|nr:site-2 protease family protein [Candidatus Paceibacterota bacterium]
FFQSIITGLEFTYRMTIVTVVGFVDFVISLFTGGSQALAEVAGPIGLFGMVADISQLGLVYLINFTAVISINLAVLNLLPFPALDGGRLLFLAIEAVKGSRLNPKIANTLNVVGFSLLLLLMAVVAVSDILKII